MKTKTNLKRHFILILLGLTCAFLVFAADQSLRFAQRDRTSPDQYPWTTNITLYNNTDKDFCRIWFQPNDEHLPVRAYLFSADQLDLFERLKAGKTLNIKDIYLSYGLYHLWLQECGTTMLTSAGSIVLSGEICGPETVMQLGEPVGPSATQTVMAYSAEPAPTPLVTPPFTEQSISLTGIYFFGAEDAQWVSKTTGVHYVHTLLRFYEDGLVIGTYLEFDELKSIDYVVNELTSELHHFNRYNATGKPNEYGRDRSQDSFYVPSTLGQKRFAYGRYYVTGNQIWFTLTDAECHHSTLTELEWDGSREYVGSITDNTLELQTYSLRADKRTDLGIVISKGFYGHDYVSQVNGKFEIVRYTGYKRWDGMDTGDEQIFQRVDIELNDE